MPRSRHIGRIVVMKTRCAYRAGQEKGKVILVSPTCKLGSQLASVLVGLGDWMNTSAISDKLSLFFGGIVCYFILLNQRSASKERVKANFQRQILVPWANRVAQRGQQRPREAKTAAWRPNTVSTNTSKWILSFFESWKVIQIRCRTFVVYISFEKVKGNVLMILYIIISWWWTMNLFNHDLNKLVSMLQLPSLSNSMKKSFGNPRVGEKRKRQRHFLKLKRNQRWVCNGWGAAMSY